MSYDQEQAGLMPAASPAPRQRHGRQAGSLVGAAPPRRATAPLPSPEHTLWPLLTAINVPF